MNLYRNKRSSRTSLKKRRTAPVPQVSTWPTRKEIITHRLIICKDITKKLFQFLAKACKKYLIRTWILWKK